MILPGTIELKNEKLYFGRTRYFGETGFRWMISDTPYPELGHLLTMEVGASLRETIELFLKNDYAGSFEQRKAYYQRMEDTCKERKFDTKYHPFIYEKYNILS